MRTSNPSPFPFGIRLACAAAIALLASACDSDKPSLQDSLAAMDAKEAKADNIKPKPRPKGLDGPTEAEFKAWDRKDPEGEKHLYKWDKAHLDDMMDYWHQLECFQEQVKVEGAKAFGAEPGSE